MAKVRALVETMITQEASAAEGKVELEYTGPEKVKYGIELALRDSPLIDEVVFV